jgi:hypothetical protein
MKTPRGKMTQYMNSLKIKVWFSSLKSKYLESQDRNFPNLLGNTLPAGNNDIIEEVNEHREIIIPVNPIEEKDPKIAILEKALEATKVKNNTLQDSLVKTKSDFVKSR